jgi:hypothetical protein
MRGAVSMKERGLLEALKAQRKLVSKLTDEKELKAATSELTQLELEYSEYCLA